jgi:FkbM family methyltransferase
MITRLGSEHGGWHVDLDAMRRSAAANPPPQGISWVIDAGVGEDISFATELIRALDVRVIGVDPSPRALAAIPEDIVNRYLLVIGAICGGGRRQVNVYANDAGSESCFSDHRSVGGRTYKARAINLGKLVAMFRPVLVKLDIEGSEYECYHQTFGVPQVCVEFHHGIVARFNLQSTKSAVADFVGYGYRIAHKTEYNEYTFIL